MRVSSVCVAPQAQDIAGRLYPQLYLVANETQKFVSAVSDIRKSVSDSEVIRFSVNVVVWAFLVISSWLLLLVSLNGVHELSAIAMILSLWALWLGWAAWGVVGTFAMPFHEVGEPLSRMLLHAFLVSLAPSMKSARSARLSLYHS